MNDKSVVRILEQYRAKENMAVKASDSLPQPLPPGHYKAYGVQPPRTRVTDIRIVYGNGRIELISKLYRSRMVLTSHQHVSIIFDSCVLILEGRNLDQLVDLIQDDEIRSLYCFAPHLHILPPEEEILITNIECRGIHEFKENINHYRKP